MTLGTWRKVLGIVLIIAAAIVSFHAITMWYRYEFANHYYNLGVKALDKGNYSLAITYFLRAISYNPTN